MPRIIKKVNNKADSDFRNVDCEIKEYSEIRNDRRGGCSIERDW